MPNNNSLDDKPDIISKFPENIYAYYQEGFNCFISGDNDKGCAYFLEVIKVFLSNLQNDIDCNIWSFVGKTSLQLAILAEFNYEAFKDKNDVFLYSDIAAKTAKKIGVRLRDAYLESCAKEILERQIVLIDCHGTQKGYLKPASPQCLQIEPTNYCNLKCSMCPHVYMKRKKGFLDPDLLKDALSGWGNRSVSSEILNLITGKTHKLKIKSGRIRMFYMGEPLMHSKIDDLIAICRNAGCLVGLQTNGVLLASPGMRRKLLASKPNAISFSLDGFDAASYESIRVGSNWEQICRNIKDFYLLRKEMGLTRDILISLTTILSDHGYETKKKSDIFFKPISEFVDSINYLTLDSKFKGGFIDKDGKLFEYDHQDVSTQDDKTSYCVEPLTKLNLLWDGSVTPCCSDIDGIMKLGDVGEGIDNVWHNNKTQSLLRAVLKHDLKAYPFCQACLSGNLNSQIMQ